MKTSTRIARLEMEGYRLLLRIRRAVSMYESEWLRAARTHVEMAVGELRIAKIGAELRRP